MLSALACAGNGVDDDIGVGQRAVHSLGGGAHQFARVLEGEVPRQGEGQIGKVRGAGAPHTRLFDRQYAGNLFHFVDDVPAGVGRNLVHQHADGFAREAAR